MLIIVQHICSAHAGSNQNISDESDNRIIHDEFINVLCFTYGVQKKFSFVTESCSIISPRSCAQTEMVVPTETAEQYNIYNSDNNKKW